MAFVKKKYWTFKERNRDLQNKNRGYEKHIIQNGIEGYFD